MKKIIDTIASLRHFRSPILPVLARFGLFHLHVCSYEFSKNGHQFTLLARPKGDQSIVREMFTEEPYKKITSLLPERPLRVLDVGAHIGTFMLWLSQYREIAEGYCFEPDPESANLCRYNVAGLVHVELLAYAIGSHSRRSAILIDPVAHSRSTIVEDMGRATNTQSVEIKVVSFVEWLAEHPGQFDLLKMDCEGSEWEILRSCPEVFSRFNAIAAEIHNDPVGHMKIEDFARSLQGYGFRTSLDRGLFFGSRT